MTTKPALALTGVMLAALGFIGTLGPFGTDAYLPAFPAMAEDLQVAPSYIGLTLSMFTIGMAVGQFFLGSLSDRIGRKTVIVSGGLLMAVASAIAGFAANADILIALCLFMGFSASAGVVGGRAVVADLTHGEAAVRPFTILGMVVSIGPILGPIGGAALLALGGWRFIFFGLAIFAVVSSVFVALVVPESLARDKRHTGGVAQMFRTAGKVLRDRQYLAFAILIWFGFGMLFTYISTSSFIVEDNLGLPPAAYAASFGVNGVGLVLAGLITTRLARKVRPRRLIRIGLIAQLAAFATLWAVILTGSVSPWTILPILFVLASSMGFIFGPATAMAMENVRFASGTALALMGSVQFLAAAVAVTVAGIVNSNALISLAEVGSVATLLVLAALIMGRVKPTTAEPARSRQTG
ncbi:MAG: multidrug effflux MFS transporter [Aurantimicrobium sp.]|nr:multidrug effflux MFS transporter [Aurantimicrobium sp.]